MSGIRRSAVVIASLALVGSGLVACGTGPSQVNSAIIIGDRSISVDEVQRRLDTALANEPAAKELANNHKLDVVSRGIVSQLIRHELLAEAAKRENLTVAQTDIDQVMASEQPSDDPMQRSIDAAFDKQERTRDTLLATELGKKYLLRLQITFDGAQLGATGTRQQAEELADKIAAQPDKAMELFAGATEQPIQGIEFNSVAGFQLASQQQVLTAPLLGAPANSVVAFSLGAGAEGQGGGWLVAHIRERNTSATLGDQEQAAASSVAPGWNQLVGLQLAGPYANELGIKISPRYGVWDELAVGVAPNEAEKVGVLVRIPSPRP